MLRASASQFDENNLDKEEEVGNPIKEKAETPKGRTG